jgi:hypothetical protein
MEWVGSPGVGNETNAAVKRVPGTITVGVDGMAAGDAVDVIVASGGTILEFGLGRGAVVLAGIRA